MPPPDKRSPNSMDWLKVVNSPLSRVDYRPKIKKTLLGYYKSRVSKKGNTVFVFTARAETRIGKTYMAMWIAEQFSKNFSIDDIVFSVDGYFDRLEYYGDRYQSYVEEYRVNKDWRIFPIILFDETGVEYGAMDFMTNVNKIMGYTLEAYAKYQVSAWFTLPLLMMLDVTGRRMLDMIVLLNAIGRGQGYKKKVHPFEATINFHKFCDVPKREGGKQKKVPLPSKALYEAYEEKKDLQLKKWITSFREDLVPAEAPTNKRQEIEKDIEAELIDIHKIDKKYLAIHYNCSMNYARDMLDLLQEKYINLKKPEETPEGKEE